MQRCGFFFSIPGFAWQCRVKIGVFARTFRTFALNCICAAVCVFFFWCCLQISKRYHWKNSVVITAIEIFMYAQRIRCERARRKEKQKWITETLNFANANNGKNWDINWKYAVRKWTNWKKGWMLKPDRHDVTAFYEGNVKQNLSKTISELQLIWLNENTDISIEFPVSLHIHQSHHYHKIPVNRFWMHRAEQCISWLNDILKMTKLRWLP